MFTLRKSSTNLVNLVEASIVHLDFMKSIHDMEKLYRGQFLANAVRRYENLWLPMIASVGEDSSQMAAPLDIEWVWYLHMLSPHAYENDCQRLVSKFIDHKCQTNEQKKMALEKSRCIWERLYPQEPFIADSEKFSQDSTVQSSKLSCDLYREAMNEKMFYYQLSMPHYTDQKFLLNAVKRYRKFLNLHSSGSNEFFCPTCDIKLIWHVHKAHPRIYRKECGSLVLYQDIKSHGENGLVVSTVAITEERWFMTYGDTYLLAGTTYRREPPQSQGAPCAGAWNDLSAPIYSLKLIKVAVCNFPEDITYILSISENCDTVEHIVTTVTGTSSEARHDGFVTFALSATSAEAPIVLSVKLTLADTKQFKTIPLLFFPDSLEAVLKEKDDTRAKVSRRDFEILPIHSDTPGKVSLIFQVLPPNRTGSYSLHVHKYEHVLEVADMAAGVTSPRSVASTFRKMGPCFVTLYGIKSYSANDVFRCRVVEPTSPSLVTVEISNVAGDVIASSHSMFQTELPTKKQVAKRLKGFPYTKTYYDLKLLIRGRNDWAICYGRVSGNSKVKLWLYLLKTRKRVEIEQPSKTSYKIKLYNVKDYIEVDTSSRDITIPRDVDDVPEILALCFSLRTLIQFKCEEEVSYVIEASRQRRLSKYSTIGR